MTENRNAIITVDAELTRARPSPAAAWGAVASVAVGTFAIITSQLIPVGLISEIGADLGLSNGMVGRMVTVPGLVAAVAAPVLAVAARRLDRRVALWILTGFLIVSNLIATLASDFTVLLAGRVLHGISLGGFWALAVSLGGRLMPENAARATAVIFAGVSLATVFGVPAGTFIGHLAGWRAAFAVTGILGVIVLVAQVVLLPRLVPDHAVRLADLPALFRNPRARLGLLAVSLVVGGHFAAYTYVAPFLVEVSGFDPSMITTLLLAYGLAGFIGNFAGGALAARSKRGALCGAALLLALVLVALPLLGQSQPMALALIAAWGLAYGAIPISLQVWMMSAAPGAPEGGSALLVSVFQLALALGSLAGGLAVDTLGIASAMWGGSLLAVATTLTVWFFGREASRSPALATS
jgi:predicted MFS family arabinose efflux permease